MLQAPGAVMEKWLFQGIVADYWHNICFVFFLGSRFAHNL